MTDDNLLASLVSGSAFPLKKRGLSGFVGDVVVPVTISDENLVAYYKMNESSSPILNKSVSDETLGTAADMAVANGTFDQTGIIGKAVSWDGSTTQGIIGSSLSQFNFLHSENYNFTVNFWYKKLNAAEDLNQQIMSSRFTTNGFTIQFDDLTAAPLFGIVCEQANNIFIGSNFGAIPQDTDWHMQTWYGNATDATVKFKLDNGTATTISEGTAPSGSANAQYAMSIGRNSQATTYWYKGLLDEFSIWNRTLTDDEISILYNSGDGFAIY